MLDDQGGLPGGGEMPNLRVREDQQVTPPPHQERWGAGSVYSHKDFLMDWMWSVEGREEPRGGPGFRLER